VVTEEKEAKQKRLAQQKEKIVAVT